MTPRLNLAREPVLVGMVHLLPLPGSPNAASMDAVIERAVADARTWERGGADALLVENFGDRPFHAEHVPPATIAAMSRAIGEVRDAVRLPVGANVLRNDAEAAIALAAAHELAFVRVNVHAGVAVTDQGLLVGRADATLRLRASLGSDAAIWADVRVKHARPLVERPLEEEAHDLVERAGADALLVTGVATGAAPDLAQLDRLAATQRRTPILLASGVEPRLVAATRGRVNGWIVGTWAKRGGIVEAPPDPARVKALVRARLRR